MYKEEYYDYSGKEGKRIKEDLKSWGFHHLTISSLPADFFRMSKSQLEKLFEHASDTFIAEMYDIPQYQVEKRRGDFDIKQLGCTINRMWREEELAQTIKEILRIVSNEYNNGNIPHTNSTPLNSEKELIYMKATGIVRRIDDLGRIVIPKEIRRTMHIKDGDPLEIFVGSGEIVFKKYSLMGEFENLAIGFAETLHKDLNLPVAICDLEHITAISGIPKKDVEGKSNSHALAVIMKNRETFLFDGEKVLYPIDGLDRSAHIIIPVICGGDILGAVIVFEGSNGNKMPSDIDVRLARFTAGIIAKQAETE